MTLQAATGHVLCKVEFIKSSKQTHFRASVTHRSICSHTLEEYNGISKILGRGYAIVRPDLKIGESEY